MSLRQLIAQHPDKFYQQTWYQDEAFMDAPIHSMPLTFPPILRRANDPPASLAMLPSVLQLANLWLFNPQHPLWVNYLWCRETDAYDQRVYVGTNGHGLEIHRHLHLSNRWAFPVWG